jgi:hypothetical protein
MATNRTVVNSYVAYTILEPSIFNFDIFSFKNGKLEPGLRDIWIPLLGIGKQHYIQFYIHGMEEMFRLGDRIHYETTPPCN